MNHQAIKNLLCEIGEAVCEKTTATLREQSIAALSKVYESTASDNIYQIDKDVEGVILPIIRKQAPKVGGISLLAEGLAETELHFPDEAGSVTARIIMDPIDGTRGIMYDKRSAFFLAGAAPASVAQPTLNSIEVAAMVELPNSRGAFSDTIWAIKGKGVVRETRNLFSGERQNTSISPSAATSVHGGFGQLARFFPPGREVLAAIEEEMLEQVFPQADLRKTIVFEDQYISSGGQMYELLVGHDRFIGDIRSLLNQHLKRQGKRTGHICHPYDVCAKLIAEEAGIILTNAFDQPFDAPFDLHSEVDWIGYANPAIKAELSVPLQRAMQKFGLLT